jgi:hypothetical protein
LGKGIGYEGGGKLAEHEAKAAHAPSKAQIDFWKKETEAELKEGYRDVFLNSPEGLEAMEQFVRSIQSHDVTREARRNVVRMVENSLLNNKGEMIGIEGRRKPTSSPASQQNLTPRRTSGGQHTLIG